MVVLFLVVLGGVFFCRGDHCQGVSLPRSQLEGRQTMRGTPGRESHMPLPNTKHSLPLWNIMTF